MNISLSSLKADPAKYYWMRYVAERSTTVNSNGDKIKIAKNELFGVRELTGKNKALDEFLLITGETFRLEVAKSEQLMNRAAEYKGRTPALKSKAPKVKPKVVLKLSAPQASRRYATILNKVRAQPIKISYSDFKKALPLLRDDVEQLAFKQWLLSYLVANKPVTTLKMYQQIQAHALATTAPKLKIVKPIKRTATVTKLTPVTNVEGVVRVKLSKIDLPEIDDFVDHDIPDEYKQYTRSESEGHSKCKKQL